MSLALGRSEEEEYADNLFMVSKLLRNRCGLLFTDKSKEEVKASLSSNRTTCLPRRRGGSCAFLTQLLLFSAYKFICLVKQLKALFVTREVGKSNDLSGFFEAKRPKPNYPSAACRVLFCRCSSSSRSTRLRTLLVLALLRLRR